MIYTLNRIMIFVRDTRACAAFYRDNFHLHPVGEWSDAWAELAGDVGFRLAFHQAWVDGRPVTAATGSPAHPHKIVFRVSDVEAARRALVDQGVAMDEVLRVPEANGLVLCDGTDCEGHRFQLCNR